MILKGDCVELDDGYNGDAHLGRGRMPLSLDEGQVHPVRQDALLLLFGRESEQGVWTLSSPGSGRRHSAKFLPSSGAAPSH